MELKVTNFNNLASNASISQTYAQKKLLGWNDIDVKANREFLRKDKELEWELQQILAGGPNWRDQMTSGGAPGAAPAEVGAGAPAAGGSATPPAFGAPAAAGAEATPPGGEATPAGGSEAAPAPTT